MTFDSEWTDDYTWATTALGSSSPDFMFSSLSLPIAAAEETEISATSSSAATIVENEHPLACQNANKLQTSCISIITGILGSMRGNSPLCLLGSHEGPLPLSSSSPRLTATTTATSVDSVLSAAREAAQLIRGLLECPICRAGPQLQLLLTVAFAEVIARYRRVISTYYSTHRQGGVAEDNSEPKPPPKLGNYAHDELSRAPLSIGSHQIDGTMEALLVGRVVGSRLQELEAVMGEVIVVQDVGSGLASQSERSEQVEVGGIMRTGGSSSTLSGLLGGLYIRRDSFLADQLGTARQELADLLLCCETGND